MHKFLIILTVCLCLKFAIAYPASINIEPKSLEQLSIDIQSKKNN